MSLFTEVIKLKDNFREKADDNLNFLTALMGNDLTALSSQVGGVVSDAVYYSAEVVEDAIQISFKNRADNSLILLVDDAEKLSEYADSIVDETAGISVNDFMQNTVSSANIYNMLADVTGRYSYLNRQKFTDIVATLNTTISNESNSLIQALSHGVNSDGFISINSFFSIINNYFQKNNDAIQNDSPILDETNPYYALDLIGIVANILQSAFNVLLIVLKGVFRVIAAILNVIINVFSSLFNMVKNRTDVRMDLDAGNNFVAGPVLACEIGDVSDQEFADRCFVRSLNSYQPVGQENERNHVYYSEGAGVGLFTWYADFQSNSNQGTRFNAYLYPEIDVEHLDFRHLLQVDNSHTVGNVYYSKWSMNNRCQDPDDEYYIPVGSSWGDLPSYNNNSGPSDARFAVLSIALSWFIRNVKFTKQMVQTGVSQPHGFYDICFWGQKMPSDSYYVAGAAQDGWQYYLWCILMNIYFYGPTSPDTSESNSGWYKFWKQCPKAQEWIEALEDEFTVYIRDHVMPYTSSPFGNWSEMPSNTPWETHQHWIVSGFDCIDSYPQFSNIFVGTPFFIINPVVSPAGYVRVTFFPVDFNNGDDDTRIIYIPDCLPANFGIMLPQISTTELITSCVLLGLAVAAVSIAAIAISNRIEKRGLSRKTLKAEQIAKKRKEFLDNPNDETKRKDYENAVYKYNLFGSIFGYGTYDGRNGWFDSASSAGNSLEQVSLDSIYSKNSALQDTTSGISTEVGIISDKTTVDNAVILNAIQVLTLLIKNPYE